MSKRQEKPSALKREHPALQKLKFINFFLFLWVIFALLDPDPDCESGPGYGSRDPTESGIQSGCRFGSTTQNEKHFIQK
jgi:hypothetical protein